LNVTSNGVAHRNELSMAHVCLCSLDCWQYNLQVIDVIVAAKASRLFVVKR
jgi:hypothetical protein